MKNPKKKVEIAFYLIKRMSPTEKRHFKLNNQIYKGEDKNFVKLFDLLNKMEVYDRGKVGDFFIKEDVKVKNLCIEYLFNKLMDSIDDGMVYLSENGQEVIMPQMKILRVYIKMELMDLAYRHLLKVEKLAEKYGLFDHLFYIYSMRASIVNLIYSGDDYVKYQEELYLKRMKLSEKIKMLDSIGYAMSLIIHYPPDNQKFKNAKTLMQYDRDDLHPIIAFNLNNAYFWYNRKLKLYKKAHEYPRNSIDIYHKNPYLITPFIESYITNWNNLLVSMEKNELSAEYYAEYQKLPQRFKKIFAKLPDVFSAFYKLIGHRFEAAYYIDNQQYKQIERLSEATSKTLEKYPTSTSRLHLVVGIYLQLTYGFILLKNNDRIQFWMDKLYHFPDIDKTATFADLMVLQLITLYEKESLILLESKIRSFKRQWKKKTHNLERITCMVNLLNSLQQKRNQNKLPVIWKAAYLEILKIETEDYCPIPYSHWVAQKIPTTSQK